MDTNKMKEMLKEQMQPVYEKQLDTIANVMAEVYDAVSVTTEDEELRWKFADSIMKSLFSSLTVSADSVAKELGKEMNKLRGEQLEKLIVKIRDSVPTSLEEKK